MYRHDTMSVLYRRHVPYSPKERVQVLISEKELSELPDDRSNIFRKSNIDCYMERPSATFCNGKCSILDDVCYAEFSANYITLEKKSSKTVEYQPDELDDNMIEHQIKHQRENIPMKMIQKTQRQAKLLQFLILCHKCYQNDEIAKGKKA